MECVNTGCDGYDEKCVDNCSASDTYKAEECCDYKPLKAQKEPASEVPCSVGLWRTIDTAPKDMTEILGWREDAGVMLMRYAAPIDFLTESELEEIGEESAEAEDWFYADFIQGGRMEGSEAPTHWMPLPDAP